MKRLGESTPSHHLEHISNKVGCSDSQKTETPMGSLSFSLFSSHLAPSKFSPLPSTSLDPRSQLSRIKCSAVERTDWMNDQPSCYLLICLASFSKKSFVICLNNHDVFSSKIQNKLLVHNSKPPIEVDSPLAYSRILASTVTIDQLVICQVSARSTTISCPLNRSKSPWEAEE